MERLRKEGGDLLYRCANQHSEPATDKRGAKVDELHLTRLEPIDRIAALAPPLRKWKICCTPCTTTWPGADTGTRLVFITCHIKAETLRSLFAAVTAGA